MVPRCLPPSPLTTDSPNRETCHLLCWIQEEARKWSHGWPGEKPGFRSRFARIWRAASWPLIPKGQRLGTTSFSRVPRSQPMCVGEGDESGEVPESQPVQRCECPAAASAPSESGEFWTICEQGRVLLGVVPQEVSTGSKGRDGAFLPVLRRKLPVSFPQTFLEHLLGARHCCRKIEKRTKTTSLLTCS